ncbi:amino acid permease [candidate division KSB1 bacterium]|nr:amino acid permease [candidate division KSB1 bacterium]
MHISTNSKNIPLLRVLGLFGTVSILVGSVIGSGIFMVPKDIATQLPYFGLILAVWVVSGVLTLFGALTYAELGGLIPKVGGQYAYLREAYGKFPAFLFGWTEFLVVKAGSIAAVAVAFATYAGYFFPPHLQAWYHQTYTLPLGIEFQIPEIGVKVTAILCIFILTVVNYLGVKIGSWVQNIFTSLKVSALLGLIVLVFIWGRPPQLTFTPFWPAHFTPDLLRMFGVAMVAALWAFDGWNNTTYVATEVLQPQRNIPRALFIGTGLVIVVYLAANLAYAYMLPIPQMAQSKLVAVDAVKPFLGSFGTMLISLAVLISTFGTVNGMILSGPRITYAMAQDKIFFEKMGEVHPRFRTPHISVLIQGVWSALLTLSGRFDQLFTYVIFAAWLFYAMTTSAVFVLRKKWPDAERPYKTLGYPWVPAAFILISLWFVYNTLVSDPRDALFGLGIVLLGAPVYCYWNYWARKR